MIFLTVLSFGSFVNKHPPKLREFKSTVKILSKLNSHEYAQVCRSSGFLTNTLAKHSVYECVVNEQFKQCFLDKITKVGYLPCVSRETRDKITNICTALSAYLNTDDQEIYINIVTFIFNKMVHYT